MHFWRKKIAFELFTVKLKNNQQHQWEFLIDNPFDQVPVLVDDERKVFETVVILDYLEKKVILRLRCYLLITKL